MMITRIGVEQNQQDYGKDIPTWVPEYNVDCRYLRKYEDATRVYSHRLSIARAFVW